ncbi:MAG: hypothetical protein V4519_05300 [Patescibacteria group bacterium]
MKEKYFHKLQKEIQILQMRNLRVDADKAWETSFVRRMSIAVVTYFVAAAVMYVIGAGNVFLNALIPTIGYILSTLSLPYIKKWWIKNLR